MQNPNPPTAHISQNSGDNVTSVSSDINIIEENMLSSQHDLSTNINQESEIITEYSFYFRPCNDFQIYHIICKEKTTDEIITQLLDNRLYLSNNYFYLNDIFVFYYQQSSDKRIYQITCEMVPHSIIVQFLNLNIYGIELNQNEQQQQQQTFSNRHKENLEFHLKQFLFNYLAPKGEDKVINECMNDS
ncbi:hypothetical protein C1645_865918 [Glomus cerebriforme]|uniref:Uncharacterized protein n=1 Tax=Glomus cerebriforme TaxID=658196 RepID=A0A397S7Y7_9GLOM|nr:hypothetical protein C1645_865918 [Glomus cerebriforme]